MQLHYLQEDSAIPSRADAPVSSFEQEETRLEVCLLVSTTWLASKLSVLLHVETQRTCIRCEINDSNTSC